VWAELSIAEQVIRAPALCVRVLHAAKVHAGFEKSLFSVVLLTGQTVRECRDENQGVPEVASTVKLAGRSLLVYPANLCSCDLKRHQTGRILASHQIHLPLGEALGQEVGYELPHPLNRRGIRGLA
jgi:hypothetical protein